VLSEDLIYKEVPCSVEHMPNDPHYSNGLSLTEFRILRGRGEFEFPCCRFTKSAGLSFTLCSRCCEFLELREMES